MEMLVLLLCTLILDSSAEVDRRSPSWTKVYVEEGTSALLPCILTVQQMTAVRTHQYLKTSVRWNQQDRNAKTVLAVDASGVPRQGVWMRPRAGIQQSLFLRGNFSLHIRPAQREDAGQYTGQIQYGEVRHECHVLLHIVRVTASPSGLLPPGASVNLTCSSTDHQPPMEVHWYQDGVQRYSLHQPGWRALSLERVTQAHSGEWRCEHRYLDGSQAQARHQLQVLGFAAQTSDPLTIYAPVGSNVQLPCILTHDPHEDIGVHWTQDTPLGRNRTLLRAEQDGQQQRAMSNRITLLMDQKQNYSLSILAVWESDAGLYGCTLTFRGLRLTRRIRLVVVKVTTERPGLIRDGTVVRLHCTLSESNGTERYTWTRVAPTDPNQYSEAGPGEMEPRRRQHTGQMLELSPVTQDDAGTWVCTVYTGDKKLGEVVYTLEVTGAQYSGPLFISGGKISFVVSLVLLILLVLTAISVLALRNRKRRLLNFYALENAGNRSSPPTKHGGDIGTEKTKE